MVGNAQPPRAVGRAERTALSPKTVRRGMYMPEFPPWGQQGGLRRRSLRPVSGAKDPRDSQRGEGQLHVLLRLRRGVYESDARPGRPRPGLRQSHYLGSGAFGVPRTLGHPTMDPGQQGGRGQRNSRRLCQGGGGKRMQFGGSTTPTPGIAIPPHQKDDCGQDPEHEELGLEPCPRYPTIYISHPSAAASDGSTKRREGSG